MAGQHKPVPSRITGTSGLVGRTVSHYRVLARLGAGGAGVVYRAQDLKLGRPVALKFLRTLAEDAPAEAHERLWREARTLATLNHPHICTVYGMEEVEGQQMIVMELVEGKTLADRLTRGPLPIEETLEFGNQLARALDAGHRLGIVHRDFKPANIMLTNSGAKLLDFGLAKLQSPAGAEAEDTRTLSLTQPGAVIGTLQYMPPEQLAGKEVDWRCDIFAFGAVLSEMVTGKKALDGVAPVQPPLLNRLINDCLAKDPLARSQSLHDVALELEWMADPRNTALAGSPTARRRPAAPVIWTAIALALLAITVGILITTRETPRSSPVAGPIHLLIDPPPGMTFADNLQGPLSDTIALSPDGTKLAATVVDADRFRKLWVRSLSSLSGEILLDTDGASLPFWSPDSRSIGYFAHQKLRIIPASGGPSKPITASLNYGGGTWNADGTILVGDPYDRFTRVSTAGGAPSAEGPPGLRVLFPWFLPDGRRFLFGARNGVSLGQLGSPNPYLLISDAGQPAFASPDSLVFLRAGRVMAQKLDLGKGRIVGEPAIAADGGIAGRSRIAAFSVSQTGVLVYRFGAPALNQLAWYSRDGHVLGPVGAPGRYNQIFLSPNEKLAAVNVRRDGSSSLGLLRLDNHILTLLASETQAQIEDGSWSPDSSQLVYEVQTPTQTRIMTISLSEATPKLLYEDAVRNYADDWSPDGKWIIYRREGRAVYIVPPDGKTKPQLLVDAPYAMDQFQFSPDTQWLAYNSLKSGQWEVYVSRFPSMRDTRQVSTAGGCQPIWRRDGKELFYLADDARLMSVPITGGSNLEADTPKELFPTSMRVNCAVNLYAATRNGDKFLMIEPAHPADVPASREPIHILINWTTALRH